PFTEGLGRYSHRHVPRATRAVRWELFALDRLVGVEEEKDIVGADSEEHVPIRVAADQLERKNLAIEPFGPVEVVDVKGCFYELDDWSHDPSGDNLRAREEPVSIGSARFHRRAEGHARG